MRQAISSMLPEVSDPRTELHPPRFVVSWKSEQGQVEKLSIDQLSGGYRIVLALAADLARRMITGQSTFATTRSNPRQIVLIDEVELHLASKMAATHLGRSARGRSRMLSLSSLLTARMVLTTVEPQRIVELARGR